MRLTHTDLLIILVALAILGLLVLATIVNRGIVD